MKTKEEINNVNEKLCELNEEEQKKVTGGKYLPTRLCPNCYKVMDYVEGKYVCPDTSCGYTEY